MTPDIINALFEFVGAIAAFHNCKVAFRDKSVKGVSIVSTTYFTSWGIWNLYYYPNLNQIYSFYGGCFLTIANFVWILLMIKYRKN